MAVLHAAIEAVHAGRLVRTALDDARVNDIRRAGAVDVIAAGKAASAMLSAFASAVDVPVRTYLGVGPRRSPDDSPLAPRTIWFDAGHPFPDEGSMAGARQALQIASDSQRGDLLVVLLSGGGSALMALPADGLTLQDKRAVAKTLMEAGADIHELNTVRKHLSSIKGGQLAAAAQGSVLTLAVSDVVGDDLSVIASGPTVPDDSTFADALAILDRRGGGETYPGAVVRRLRDGAAGLIADTPAAGDPRLSRASARVIGAQRGAIEGARRAAVSLGYHVVVVDEPVAGEARVAGTQHVDRCARAIRSQPRPICVIASGETTVTVAGSGKGGRNQEFAFAMAQAIHALGPLVAAASIGTDGIDGPTDAAGALVDPTTFERARAAGMAEPERFLTDNNTYAFFDRLGDLIRTGPTSTNVGDVQVILVDEF
jgi:hydroxypyruvate reductase